MKKLIEVVILIILSMGCASEKPSQKNEDKPPNIVFIFADDLGYGDLGCFGALDINTPNIDELSNQGIRFTNFYSASSICSPSRAALLTGRLPQRMGINGVFFPESFAGMSPSEITIPELLKEKNYSSGLVGKWHLGHRQEYLPLQQGFDNFFGTPYSNDMTSLVYLRGNEVEEFEVDQHYLTSTYTKEALDFIEQNKQNPFFLYVAHNMPHVPLYASPRFEGKSEKGLYGDVIEELDWSVGQIVSKLEALDLIENTIVVFSSDNGPWLVMKDHGGSPGILREGKQFTFEGGMRVPTIAMWKGKIKPKRVSHNMASQMDWFPTFAKIAGIQISEGIEIDGEDISGVLFDTAKRQSNDYLFLDGSELQGYRQGDWKIKMPFKGYEGSRWKKAVAAHDTLMFNLKDDSGEKNNLYLSNKETAKKLIQDMHIKYEKMGKLPSSLILRTPEDNSHYKHLINPSK